MEEEMVHVVCSHCKGVNRVPDAKLGDQPRCGRCQRALFTAVPLSLDQDDFDRFVNKSEIPLLVDFWAPWCGPCRMMAPAFEQAASLLEPRVQLIKINTEEQQSVAAKYGIRSIPTLILFKAGAEVARVSGAMDSKGLVAWTEQNL
jgi:thioredoxin 2